jgi:rhodanese-related sulfurtransferase
MVALRRVSTDLVGVVILAMASLIVGLMLNYFRPNRLSLVYKTPEERLRAELSHLIMAPPFQSLPINVIDLGEFRDAAQKKDALILDARSSLYYREGHVPTALNLPRDNFAADYVSLRPTLEKSRDRRVIVYCSGGDCRDSKMVAQALMSLGFSNVMVFGGGWEEWTATHLPQARG